MPKFSLRHNHVDIFIIEPHKASTELLDMHKRITSPQEQEKILKKHSEEGQRDALVTRGLVRSVLSQYATIKPNQWQFGKGWNGKPFIENTTLDGHSLDIEFNLSHATELIALAVTSTQPLGLDVEYTRRKSNTYKLAPRYFSPSEITALQAQPYAQQAIDFYDYWTLKESYIKACGDGLAIPLHHFSFDTSNRDNITMSFSTERNDNPKQWHNVLFDVTAAHKMALTVKTKNNMPVTTSIYRITSTGKIVPTTLPLK